MAVISSMLRDHIEAPLLVCESVIVELVGGVAMATIVKESN